MATPMTSTLYRQSASAATPTAHSALYMSMPAPKPFAAGAVTNGAERNRLMELLRAPNNLTSPTLEPSSKGLLNGPGQNNCFLNCAVQELKELIYRAHEQAPKTNDPNRKYEIKAYYKAFEESFFTDCYHELQRVNNFFLQKFAEAKGKFIMLKVQLLETTAPRAAASPNSVRSLLAEDRKRVKTMSKRQLRHAMSEFYLSLILLQNYQTLNTTGFRKICKKYDKNFKSKKGLDWFKVNVLPKEFSDTRLLERRIEEVEELFTQHLSEGDRNLAMAKLRVPPLSQPTAPALVFQSAFALGLFLCLALVTLVAFFKGPPLPETREGFIRLYRGPFTMVLFFMYMAANVVGWQNSGVNYVLIFEINPREHLQPANFLGIACGFGLLACLSVLAFLFHDLLHVSDPYVFSFVLHLAIFFIIFNPLPMLHRASRFWLLLVCFRVITAPFHYVTFADFWMGDQMNSLVICFSDFYYVMRFFLTCWRRNASASCFHEDLIVPISRCLPAWFRFAQCLRRFRDSGSKSKGYLINAGKYATTFVVVIFWTLRNKTNCMSGGLRWVLNLAAISCSLYFAASYANTFQNPFTWLYISAHVISTIYCYVWDVFKDFGLFQLWRGNLIFLREHLVYPQPFYYFAIVENLFLRCFWAVEFTALQHELIFAYHSKILSAFLEITRRYIWNYIRLENEHLNNCGRFRAIREIHVAPLNYRQERLLESIMDESDTDQPGSHRYSKIDKRFF